MEEWHRPIDVRLLGPVAIDGPGEAPPRRSRLLRTLLAELALEPGTPVGVGTLVDELWGTDLPQNPTAALQVQVSRLRAWLAEAAPNRCEVPSTRGGYALQLDGRTVDLVRFRDEASRALATGATPDEVLEAGGRALAEWRGDPFGGCVPAPRLEAERVRAVERLLRVVEAVGATLLDRGRHDDALDTVLPHLTAHRHRERLTALTMTALHRAGRTHEALTTYADTRRHLREEYGLDPSPELAAVEQRILAAPSRPKRRPAKHRIVGRDDDLASIRAHLDDPDTGALLVLSGEAGIGKTSLMRAARDEAAARGVRVGAGTWDEDATPLTGWAEALDELDLEPLALGESLLGRALRARLVTPARDGEAVLVTLDDVHRADSASLSALRALVRLGLPAGVVVLVAAREPDAVAHPGWSDAHADLARHDGVTTLRLDELDEPAARALVAARLAALGDPAARRVADDLWTRTRGHPLHLAALLDTLAGLPDEAACLAAAAEVPPRLRPLLDHQLGRLPADCRRALDALAVLRPIRLTDLAGALADDPRRVADALRPAADLGLVVASDDRFAFRHELTAVAVLDAVPTVTAAHLHHVRWQAAADAAPFERLRHAVGAAALLDPGVVADARLAAARDAYERGALDEALDLLDAAGEGTTGPPSTVGVHRGLVLEALGRHDEADDALDAVVEDATADVADTVVAAVGHDAMGISVAGRPRRLKRLRQVRERTLTEPQRARVLRALILEEEQVLGDVADTDALPELLELAAGGGTDGDPRLLGQVRALEANRLADAAITSAERLAVGREAHALAARAGDHVLRLETEELLIASLVAAGRVDEAVALRTSLEPEARDRHHPRSLWAVMLLDASLLLARGNTDAADGAAQRAAERGHELGIPDALGAFGVHLLARNWLAGTLPTLGGLPAQAAQMYPHVAAWSAAAAVDALQAGDRDAGAAHLADWHRKREGREGRLFDRPGLCLAAAAGFALGDVPTAEAVLRGLPSDPGATVVVGIGAAVFGPIALFQGLASSTLGDAGDLFATATRVADGLGWAPWADAARTLGAVVVPGRRPAGHPPAVAPPDAVLPLGLSPTPP